MQETQVVGSDSDFSGDVHGTVTTTDLGEHVREHESSSNIRECQMQRNFLVSRQIVNVFRLIYTLLGEHGKLLRSCSGAFEELQPSQLLAHAAANCLLLRLRGCSGSGFAPLLLSLIDQLLASSVRVKPMKYHTGREGTNAQ